MSRLVIILPPDLDTPLHWLTFADGAVTASGKGDDWPRLEPNGEGVLTPAMLVAPAAAVTLHRALLPDLAPRQALAAARLMAVENALGSPEELHVAVGPRDPDGALDVAVVANADMAGWLSWAQSHGLDPYPVVPAGLLLDRPDEGFVRARVGAETIARDKSSAFAVDPELADLLFGDAAVVDVAEGEAIAALIAAADAPPLDLRQGVFARRTRRDFDWNLVRRAAVLVGLILLGALAISLVRIFKLDNDTDRLDARTIAIAKTVDPGVTSAAQAEAALDVRAAAAGVGGRGFAGGAARVFAALDQSPSAVLTEYSLNADGTVRATIAAPTANDLDVAVAALRSSGAGATTTPATGGDGRQSVVVTVSPR